MTYYVLETAKADLKHIYFEGAALFGETQVIAYAQGFIRHAREDWMNDQGEGA